jgi:hypothetical protein
MMAHDDTTGDTAKSALYASTITSPYLELAGDCMRTVQSQTGLGSQRFVKVAFERFDDGHVAFTEARVLDFFVAELMELNVVSG